MFLVLCWNQLDSSGDLRRIRSAGRVSFYESGGHDGSGGVAVLENTEANWTVDGFVGRGDAERLLHNVTDGSSGIITGNTKTEMAAVLSGGTNNYWSPGDQYEVRYSQLTQYVTSGGGKKFNRHFKHEKSFYDIVAGEFSDTVETIIRVSPQIAQYLDANELWTDGITGLKGPPTILMAMAHERELYNNPQSPLYSAGFNPVTTRVNNLELIHAKTGWHRIECRETKPFRPIDLLIYYGYPNSFNSAIHGWNNENVAQEMAKYGQVVLGNGVADSGHGDYANTTVIILRIKVLNPLAKVFGYASVNQSQANFEAMVDAWEVLGVDGIFMDEAGYDYETNDRASFNLKVDYVHEQTSAKVCYVNAWNMDHILGTADDPGYPNSTKNPSEVESNLTENDWYLLESHPINTTAFSGTGGYQSKTDWAFRAEKAKVHRYNVGINIGAAGIIDNDNVNGQDLFDFGFVAAMMYSLDAFGTSDTSYGSGAAVKWWTRPDVSRMGLVKWLGPVVVVEVGDAEVYLRYVQNGRFILDFSSAANLGLIEKW